MVKKNLIASLLSLVMAIWVITWKGPEWLIGANLIACVINLVIMRSTKK